MSRSMIVFTVVAIGLHTAAARTEEPATKKNSPTAAITDKDRDFWAFQSPKRPAVPEVKSKSLVRNPIDAFLLAKLEDKQLSFNSEASKEVLLRRVCFDLTGLPPTLEQRTDFLNDNRSDAYERLVDRLLASPAYGERWGRHWLDIAGYADSDGYLAADRLRPQAWRYRDYVIQSLNDDVPYDRFVTEQLAGDELSDWRRAEELTPEMIRQLTATGFLRNALDPTYPGYTEPNEIHQVLSDTMQIVGSTFLGMTIQCAKCHTHKFDPITQKDYFSLQTVFITALDPDRWQPSEKRGIPMVPEAEAARIADHNKKITARVAELNTTLTQLTAAHRKMASNPKATEAELSTKYPEYKAEVDKLRAAIAAEQALTKELTLIRGVSDLDGKVPDGRILLRGDYTKPGDVVPPSIPEVLAPASYQFKIKEGYKTSGRRLALAKWLTDPAHPLTARVQVNRMWAQHFGRGIVPTVANFGKSGVPPTHPELLDWLAIEFINQKWSMKAMHRLMVTSTAYRQSSAVDAEKLKTDPTNTLLGRWKPRRLEGEAIRDAVLAVSGKLKEDRFGPPVPVAVKGDSSIDTNDDAMGNRRSIYLIVRRSQHLTLFDLFDTPMMEVNCPERPVSTVPLQALVLMNSPFSERSATALADRILKDGGDSDESRCQFAFRLLFGREVKANESALIGKFVAELLGDKSTLKDAWTQAALVLLNSNEFLYLP